MTAAMTTPVEIPARVLQQLALSVRSRYDLLQRLRRARYLATIESGRNAGKVHRPSLFDERERLGLHAAEAWSTRSAVARRLADFVLAAANHGIDGRMVIAELRDQHKADLLAKPQYLTRGCGYYPSRLEVARAQAERAAHERAMGDAFRARLRAAEAGQAIAAAAKAKTEQERALRLGTAMLARRQRRGLPLPTGKPTGRPLLPTDLRPGDRVLVQSASGVIEMDGPRSVGGNAKLRQFATGGVLFREGRWHPVREVDLLRQIRERRAARRAAA